MATKLTGVSMTKIRLLKRIFGYTVLGGIVAAIGVILSVGTEIWWAGPAFIGTVFVIIYAAICVSD